MRHSIEVNAFGSYFGFPIQTYCQATDTAWYLPPKAEWALPL